MTSRTIKRFQLDGTVMDTADLLRLRKTHENVLIEQMRADGYVPLLDLDPVMNTSFDGTVFHFVLTMHGVYYGPKKAKKIYGITNNREVPMA